MSAGIDPDAVVEAWRALTLARDAHAAALDAVLMAQGARWGWFERRAWCREQRAFRRVLKAQRHYTESRLFTIAAPGTETTDE